MGVWAWLQRILAAGITALGVVMSRRVTLGTWERAVQREKLSLYTFVSIWHGLRLFCELTCPDRFGFTYILYDIMADPKSLNMGQHSFLHSWNKEKTPLEHPKGYL